MIQRVLALAVLLILNGCGGQPVVEQSSPRKGGYYLDDGPGDREPDNLDAIPDARPRVEPVNAYTARPYTVLGKTYVPYATLTSYKARGVASWYGRRYNGQRTSTGEIYDMYAMTAAHTILPLPSYARVTNLGNGKSAVVRVNDRGPFHADRIIDLSYAAAKRIGIVGSGKANVEVEAILPGRDSPPAEVAAASEAAAPVPAPSPARAESPGFYVQLGAFSSVLNADDFLKKMRLQLGWLTDSLNVWSRDGLYRVHAGPYANREQALAQSERIQTELGIKPLVVTR
jgi:rare lipoprotein A